MNPNTPPPRDDDLPDERELAALYARLPKDEPGPALDAAVLARAAQAVPTRRRPRWPLALASAAVLVLAVGVAWQVRETRPDESKALPSAIAEKMPAPVPGPAPASAPVETPLLAPGVADNDSRRAEAFAPAKPAARSARKVTGTAGVVPKVVRSAAAPVAAPMVSSAPAEPPAPPTPMAPAVPPMAASPAPERAVEAFSEAGPDSLAPRRPDLAPDDRVGEIRRLLDRGQREEALRRLHDLRLRYPRYDLPQDLRDLKP